MVISPIDSLAWYVIRLVGLIQSFIGELIMCFYKPNPCEREGYKHFQLLTSMMFGGMMIFHSRSPNDLPKMVSDKLLFQGKILLTVFVFSLMRSFR